MFIIVVPFAIFVLPALLKKLDCAPAPVEIGDGSVARGVAGEIKKIAKVRYRNDNEGARENRLLETRNSKPEGRAAEVSMDEEEIADVKPECGSDFLERSEGHESTEVSPAQVNDVQSKDEGCQATAEPIEALPRGAGSGRRTSSRVADLRAAFEQTDAPPEMSKKRFHSGDRSSQQNVEITKEYEAQIGRLKDELDKEIEMRLAYEEKVTSMEEEIEQLNSRLEEQDAAWREKYERRCQQGGKSAQSRLNGNANETENYRLEVTALRNQLSELKRGVSTSTRPSTHISDATFRDEMGLLQHEVQNWVVNNFRRVKIEAPSHELCDRLGTVTEPKQFELLRPVYERFESARKLPIFQSTVATYLLDIFADPHLFGLPPDTHWVERLQEAAVALPFVLSAASYNRWRAMTLDALRQCDSVKDLMRDAAHSMAKKINTALITVAASSEDETSVSSLTTIIKRAIDLAHLMQAQEAQYSFSLPIPGAQFDGNCMDDITEDGDADAERTIRCASFVSVVKISDETGERFESMKIIFKAKVLCENLEP